MRSSFSNRCKSIINYCEIQQKPFTQTTEFNLKGLVFSSSENGICSFPNETIYPRVARRGIVCAATCN
jgi:hypothetical protein